MIERETRGFSRSSSQNSDRSGFNMSVPPLDQGWGHRNDRNPNSAGQGWAQPPTRNAMRGSANGTSTTNNNNTSRGGYKTHSNNDYENSGYDSYRNTSNSSSNGYGDSGHNSNGKGSIGRRAGLRPPPGAPREGWGARQAEGAGDEWGGSSDGASGNADNWGGAQPPADNDWSQPSPALRRPADCNPPNLDW